MVGTESRNVGGGGLQMPLGAQGEFHIPALLLLWPLSLPHPTSLGDLLFL